MPTYTYTVAYACTLNFCVSLYQYHPGCTKHCIYQLHIV